MNEAPNGQQSAPAQKRDLLREGIQIASPALGISFIFLLTALVQVILDMAVRRHAPALASADWYGYLLSMVPMYVVAMPLSLLLFRLGRAEPPEEHPMRASVFVGLLALCFGLTYAGNFVGQLVNSLLGAIRGAPISNPVADMTASSPLWVNLLFVGILAPVMEEIFYRKLVIDRLRRYGDLPAILLSGIAFGLVHGNFSQFFYAATLGCLFGYIYLNTGRIRYTIFLHMGINLVGGVYTSEMLKHLNLDLLLQDPARAIGENLAGVVMFLAYAVFVVAVLIGSVIALILLCVRCRRPLRRAENPLRAGEWCRVLLCNPAIWLFLFFVLLLFL